MFDETPSSSKYRVIFGDAEASLKEFEDNSVDLIVSSPPYNINKEYEKEAWLSHSEYDCWATSICTELVRILKPTGSLCWQVGNHVTNGEIFPLDYLYYGIFKELNLHLRNRIIWRYNFGYNAKYRFSGRYETLLWFTASDNYTFNLDSIRIPQLYPGKRHSSSKGDRAGKPSGNPLGKNPSDFWEFEFHASDYFGEDAPNWEIPNVKANHPEVTPHPCQFPSELVERCVLAFTKPGDIVLDPFLGAGTTIIGALAHGRTGLGIEKQHNYVELAERRIIEFLAGNLRLRPMGKPVRRPRPNEKVATIPEEWARDAEG